MILRSSNDCSNSAIFRVAQHYDNALMPFLRLEPICSSRTGLIKYPYAPDSQPYLLEILLTITS